MGITTRRAADEANTTGTTADEPTLSPDKTPQSHRGETDKGGSELKTTTEGRQGGKMEP